jgi:hypothetical protein
VDVLHRVIADSRNEPEWLAARVGKIGASDAAAYAKLESVEKYARAKLNTTFTGNRATALGHQWEAAALAAAGWEQNTLMFADANEPAFAATPDGIRPAPGGLIPELAEMKLTKHPKARIPATHRRQMWWAQMVCGAERTMYLEMPYDDDGHPIGLEPNVVWFDRDEQQIALLLEIAYPVLRILRAADEMKKEFS